jgi:DNA invertase Pin-like site-specific DNA recombinase
MTTVASPAARSTGRRCSASADIAAGRVDLVVVYKVDRLTRSLGDFSKIVEAFDAQGVSLSRSLSSSTPPHPWAADAEHAAELRQFEREVTGERIRDKIAASKRKGMWMGGTVPLGYAGAGPQAGPSSRAGQSRAPHLPVLLGARHGAAGPAAPG